MASKRQFLASVALSLFAGVAFAGTSDLSGVAETLTTNIKSLADLLIIIAYVAGIGFALAGVIQFKAHKDNPAQVPLSKPMVYIAVGAALLFLPSLMSTAGSSIFSEGGISAGTGDALSEFQD